MVPTEEEPKIKSPMDMEYQLERITQIFMRNGGMEKKKEELFTNQTMSGFSIARLKKERYMENP